MSVDSFKWLPRSIAGYYKAMQMPEPDSIPWTPLAKPIAEARFALVTSAGVYIKGEQKPFDLERERLGAVLERPDVPRHSHGRRPRQDRRGPPAYQHRRHRTRREHCVAGQPLQRTG